MIIRCYLFIKLNSNGKNKVRFYRISFILWLFVIAGTALFVFFFYFKTDKKPEIDTEKPNVITLIDNMAFLKPFELRSEGYNLSSPITIMDENGKILTFGNLLDIKGTVLVYRFAEIHCDLCIQQHLMILKDLLLDVNFDKLVLLGAYTSTKK